MFTMRISRTLFIIIAIFSCVASFANPVGRSAAINAAQRMLKGKRIAVSSVKTNADMAFCTEGSLAKNRAGSAPAFYVCTAEQGRGFAIVSGEDAFPEIIAYSHEGTFDISDLNPGAKAYLENFANLVADVRMGKCDAPLLAAQDEAVPVVEPLIKTQWTQEYPFNVYCPKDGTKNSLVGCVATAFAQIMKYWEWPKVGKSKLSHTCSLPGYGKIEIDFSKSEYNWKAMPNTKAEIMNNEEAKDAVGKLCYECGVATRMEYSASGSGTQDCYSMQALYSYMRYKASTMTWHRRECFSSQEEWDKVWKREIDAGRPLLYAAVDEHSGGHAFILDGYDSNGYAHFNWGWGGKSDGYYSTILMNPPGYSFTEGLRMITGIQPDYEDEDTTPKQWRAYLEEAPRVTAPGATKLGAVKMFNMPVFYNLCPFYCAWEVGVCLYDKAGQFIANVKKADIINGDEIMVPPYRGMSVLPQIVLPADLQDGDYTLRAAFKLKDYEEWEMPYVVGGDELNSIPVMIEDGLAYFNQVSSSIRDAEDYVSRGVVSSGLFDLQGRKLVTPSKGSVVIKRTTLSDGTVESKKVLVR